MQCVILAAGKGERMRPLTDAIPKPLVKVAGKPLIQRVVEALPEEVDELILVVGYKGDQIKKFCGDNFCGRKVSYVWQKERLGNGHALRLCASYLQREKFMVVNSDDILGKEGLKNCLQHELCLLVAEHQQPSRFGVVVLRKDGSIGQILEKPDSPPTNLVNAGVIVLDKRIFDYKAQPAANGEIYLTAMLDKMILDHKIFAEKADLWYPIASPADLKEAERVIITGNGQQNRLA